MARIDQTESAERFEVAGEGAGGGVAVGLTGLELDETVLCGWDCSGVARPEGGLQERLSLNVLASIVQEVGEGDLGDRRPLFVVDVDGGPVGVFGGIGAVLLGEPVAQQSGGSGSSSASLVSRAASKGG